MDKNMPSPIGGEGIFIFPSDRPIQRGTPESCEAVREEYNSVDRLK